MSEERHSATVKLLSNLQAAVDLTKAAISDFALCLEENVEDAGAFKCYDSFVNLSTDYVNALEDLSSTLSVDLNWLPFRKPPESETELSESDLFPSPEVNLTYADGQTPWSFWLAYSPSSEYQSLLSALHVEWREGKLKNVSEMPPVGSFVICCDRDTLFRAIVLSSKMDKAKVRNIDDTAVKVVKLDKMFCLNRKWRSLHAQTVQCCLTKDESLMNIWNSDLKELFKNTLKEAILSVVFVEECADCIPAKFLVHLKTNGRITADLNAWICERIFPELFHFQDQPEALTLEELPESVVDPYYSEERDTFSIGSYKDERMIKYSDKQVDEGSKKVEGSNMGRWSSNLFEPSTPLVTSYYLTPSTAGAAGYPVYPIFGLAGSIPPQCPITLGSSNMDGSSNVFQVSPHLTSASGFIVKQVAVANTTLNVNTPVFEPRKKSKITVTELKNDTPSDILKSEPTNSKDGGSRVLAKSSSSPSAGGNNSAPVEETDICPMFLKSGFCLRPACSKKHVKSESDSNENDQKARIKLEAEVVSSTMDTVEENSVKKYVNSANTTLETNLSAEGSNGTQGDGLYEEDDEDLDEPCITNGYMPKDESRVCKFPSINGRCWKSQCNKEHEDLNQNKWTTDKEATLTSTFNLLILPKSGETVELLVTHVRNPFTFYARLPDVYSDIGEGVLNIETFRSLHKTLNDPKNIKQYRSLSGVDPAEGELYIARGARDRLWKRSRILDTDSRYVTVFYIDYGDEEKVPLSELRLIEDRFNHLPVQAVHCTLSGLFCDTDDVELRIRGRKFLGEQIKGQVIIGKVINRKHDDSLELIVSCNNININKLMACKGFCELIRSGSPSSML